MRNTAYIKYLTTNVFLSVLRAEQELILDTEDPEGGWVDTHHFADQVPAFFQ